LKVAWTSVYLLRTRFELMLNRGTSQRVSLRRTWKRKGRVGCVPYHARTNGEVKGGRGDGERWKRRRQEKEGTLGVNDESFGNEQL
jgi:hypothetical protein